MRHHAQLRMFKPLLPSRRNVFGAALLYCIQQGDGQKRTCTQAGATSLGRREGRLREGRVLLGVHTESDWFQSCSCSMQYLKVNGMASKRLSTSLKKAREVFIFRPYCLEGSRL